MNNSYALIEEMLRLDEKRQAYNVSTENERQTFFEIIGRDKDEDLISRALAYALKEDKKLFGKLLSYYFECDYFFCTVTDIKCEKSMLNGRADVFVKGRDKNGNLYTLTIENKIDSREHDGQTQIYFDYVTNHPDFRPDRSRNAFLFLKPDYNYSPISCGQFKQLLYSDLLTLIDGATENVFLQDFRDHIKKYLVNKEVNFMEVDTFIFQNFGTLKRIFGDAEKKLENFKQRLFQEICTGNLIDGLDVGYNVNSRKENRAKYTNKESDDDTLCVWTESNKIQIFRDKWYYEPDTSAAGYYFYVEMMFRDNDPNEIIFQKAVRDYSDKLIVREFCRDCNESFKDVGDKWTVFTSSSEEDYFRSNYGLLSPEWKAELKTCAVRRLSQLIKETDEIFKRFREWKKDKGI